MSKGAQENAWDFSPVYDLLKHLSTNGAVSTSAEDNGGKLSPPAKNTLSSPSSGLGNFDRLWEFLGQPLDIPLQLDPDVPIQSIESGDGAEPKDTKAVRWRDEIDGADLADDDDAEPRENCKGLSKKQRQKANRKKRRQALAEAGVEATSVNPSSENESGSDSKEPRLLDRKSVIYDFIQQSSPSPICGQSAIQVLRRPQPALDLNVWPVARPNISNGDLRAASAPPGADYAVAAARKQDLMSMLLEKYPDDRQFLNNASLLPHPPGGPTPTPEGIHVFVDASNIMIGFHDALKAHHSLPPTTRLRRQPLSFHNLSLILTRGRPTAKQVLVGSDNFPAIQEAKAIGYETNILDRVHKAKELTPRQRRFLDPNEKRNSNGHNYGSTASGGSGSETGPHSSPRRHAPPPVVAKWTEQAVDEILHLKMMESLVDHQPSSNPSSSFPSSSSSSSSTMILASGDAAEAEYSGGFLKMVERALVKGWRVELASFRANTSGMYRRREFRERWEGRFVMVELDDFVECLMGVE